MFASALTQSQIVAFIMAMFLCWVFYDGFELLGNFSQIGGLDYLIKYVGIAFHYEAIKKGVIDTSDILYFISLNALFLFASLTVLKSLKK
jgi:ABC-2 type transport system permease protein